QTTDKMKNHKHSQPQQPILPPKHLLIHSIPQTIHLYPITPTPPILYPTIYLNHQITLHQIPQQLQITNPTITTPLKKLQHINILKKTFHPPPTKHTFLPQKHFFNFFTNFFPQKSQPHLHVNLPPIDQPQITLQHLSPHHHLHQHITQEPH
ncbi:GbsR/MarR family transcriptional regulator, partial [Bacillus pumilus]|uniref:GbsR/MarR family transcriptional regulator n=1 Tax=Bacillus pumilus TaxID=1408 RepID=UPI001C92C684